MTSSIDSVREVKRLREIPEKAGFFPSGRLVGVFAGVGNMPLLHATAVGKSILSALVGVGSPRADAAEVVEWKSRAPTRPLDSANARGALFLEAVLGEVGVSSIVEAEDFFAV